VSCIHDRDLSFAFLSTGLTHRSSTSIIDRYHFVRYFPVFIILFQKFLAIRYKRSRKGRKGIIRRGHRCYHRPGDPLFFLSPLQSESLRPSSFLIQYGISLITYAVFSALGQRRAHISSNMIRSPPRCQLSSGHLEYARFHRVTISVRTPYVTYCLAAPFLSPRRFFSFRASTLNACKWLRTGYNIY
jgi:hypothetical protein